MGDGVGLGQAGQACDLVGAFADADRVAHMLGRGPGQGHALRRPRGLEFAQSAVDRGGAHRQHLPQGRVVDAVEFAVGLQGGYPLSEHGLHVRAARHAHQQPQALQQHLRVPPVPWPPAPFGGFARCGRDGLREQAACGGPAHAHGLEPVEDLALLLFRALGVFGFELVRQLLLRGHVESAFHKASIPEPQRRRADFALTLYEEQTPITRSKITMNVAV